MNTDNLARQQLAKRWDQALLDGLNAPVFYARGSAMECAAVLDICRIRGVGSAEEIHTGRQLLLRLVQMLTRLSKAG